MNTMQPKLIVEQKITVFTNKYRVYASRPDAAKAEPLAFVQQKRLAFKEKVAFCGDEARSQPLFTFRAEKVFDVHGRYLVEDAGGQLIGGFKKQFGKSLINSTWNILDLEGNPVITVSESNQALAILRRFIGYVPIVGDLAEIAIKFFRYHFQFIDVASGKEIGRYKKTKLFRDHYLLSMTDTAYAENDWRVLAAMAVALDALQSR